MQKQKIQINKQEVPIEQQTEDQTIFKKLIDYLGQNKVQFEVLQHQPTRTSTQSSLIRNTPLEWGCKTMLVQNKDDVVYLIIYRASNKISWSKLRKIEIFGKKCKMCPEETVIKLGVKPGGVPPFAKILQVKGILDSKFFDIKEMAFNAGLKNKSIIMRTQQFPKQDVMIFDLTD